ncbi:MAG: hypothetical protein A2W80_19675 [Candidatus Riflebacteria bacterium GWC2_50_8]|nr:MAG: hypothetical protein A2W80_19675 [Candidatus Riflebacteria bacterium GWC2_50_8]
MKKILLLALVLIAGAAFWLMQATQAPTHYGAAFGADVPQMQMKDLYADPDSHLAASIVVTGKITRQCPSSGCWFYLDDNSGKQVKIELGHMGIKFPQWLGKNVKVEGQLLKNKDELELVGTAAEFF